MGSIESAVAVLTDQLEEELPGHDDVQAVDRDPSARRWYVRIAGEAKDFVTIWFTVGDRGLHHETGFMPPPEENLEDVYRYVLKLNKKLVGAQFSIGSDDAIYLVGAIPIETVDAGELDRLIGTIYATVDAYWTTAMRIGFESKFTR